MCSTVLGASAGNVWISIVPFSVSMTRIGPAAGAGFDACADASGAAPSVHRSTRLRREPRRRSDASISAHSQPHYIR